MNKQDNIIFKKIKTVKNKRISNKGVLLGRNKLMGRYYDAGPSFVASFKSRRLSRALQYYGLNVSTKVGWLLIKGLIELGTLKVKNFNFEQKDSVKILDFYKFKVKNKSIYNIR